MRLKDKIAIVTGAGSGIGRACAIAFAREGAKVALVARKKDRLQKVADQIGSAALIVSADITRKEDVARIVSQAAGLGKGVHILVNSAAYLTGGTAESHTEEDWDLHFDTNVKALWLLSRAVLPEMRKAGGGSIVNISSVLGLVGARNRVAYAASKGAVTLLTKSMALDHAAENIRVNCVCPGIVDTDLVAGFISQAPDPAAARKQREALHPLGRFGQPEDIARLCVYLAGDESSWMTGAAIPLDGGYTAL